MQNTSKNSIDQKYDMIKKNHTNTLLKAISENKADLLIIPFLLEITKIPDIFTSSSCAGRIMLLSTDENESKKVSHFHKRFHRVVTFDEIKSALNEDTSGEIWLKAEPFIFHFGAKDYIKAKEILDFCQQFGLKKSGIIASNEGKFIIEVTYTQFMALPVKKDNLILVDDFYLNLIVSKANTKMELNFKRLKYFENAFLNNFLK
ncbi:MAG: hypothetical protein PHN22_01610 [Candidatus ainarchaeum sp.]|nr:hypothetical protein [Candidatus ainarchaeum sp.]